MSRLEQIQHLNRLLLEERPEYRAQAAQFPPDEAAQRRLLRRDVYKRQERNRLCESFGRPVEEKPFPRDVVLVLAQYVWSQHPDLEQEKRH